MKKKKAQDVLQSEVSECGLACVSYIADVYGKEISIEKLRNQYDVSLDGLSFFHLMKICAEHQLIATGVNVATDALNELEKPAILLWNNCHFVVLKQTGKKGIKVMDPAVGSRYFTYQEVQNYFSGVALEVFPDENFSCEYNDNENEKSQRVETFFSPRQFQRGLLKYKSYMLPLAAMAVVVQLTNVAIPKFISLVFDEVLPKNDEDFLFLLLYIFGFIYLIQAVSDYLKISLAQRLRRVLSQLEGLNIVSKLFQMDLKFFSKRMPSDLLRKIKSVDVFHVIYTQGWSDIIIETIFVCIFMVLLFLISFELALLTIAITVLMILLRVLLVPILMSRQYSSLDAEVRRDNILLQSIDNINMIKIGHTEYRKINEWFSHHAELEYNRSSIEKINALIEISVNTLSHLQTLVIMGMGALSVFKGESTAGQLISFIFYKNCLMDNVQSIIAKHVNLKICSVEVKRLKDITPESVDEKENFKAVATEKIMKLKKITVKNLSFGYSNLEDEFIKNINFEVLQGEKLVVTGPSGCGKTTILNLLAGLLIPSKGEILVNDISLARFGLYPYQEQISLIAADDRIINGSVLDNIIYESIHHDMKLLEICIEQADFDNVIRSLSAGLNTRLGTNGARLSSGQQQRLLIARALYRKPQLILLDEPTSHLDQQTRDKIIDLIKALPVACIIVSHDEKLIKAIDKRIIFNNAGG